jgi:peptidylprolyl isomerase
MKKKYTALLLLTLVLVSFSSKKKYPDLKDGIYAEIVTSKGTMVAELYYEKAPMTVANFVALAEGKHPLMEKEYKKKPFYNGLIFHRVIENFMIQGGDKTGTGGGNIGYKFPQEVSVELKHDAPGVLSMANAGPGTNGSQFFIMHKASTSLDMRYNVFGKVIKNVTVVDSIATVAKNASDKPLENVYMKEINIIRVGRTARKWKADKVFTVQLEEYKTKAEAEEKKIANLKANAAKTRDAKMAAFAELKPQAKLLPSGVQIYMRNTTAGERPENNTPVELDYSGFFPDGRLFDSSSKELSLRFDNFNQRKDDSGAYIPMKVVYNSSMSLIPGFKEAVLTMGYGDELVVFIPADQAYGVKGAGGAIPANADLVFEINMMPKK